MKQLQQKGDAEAQLNALKDQLGKMQGENADMKQKLYGDSNNSLTNRFNLL